jgi:hypothetical protein
VLQSVHAKAFMASAQKAKRLSHLVRFLQWVRGRSGPE